MADPETGGSLGVGDKQTGSGAQRQRKGGLRAFLGRISERSPVADGQHRQGSAGLRHASGAENKRAYELNSQADVLGKGAAAQVLRL